MEKTPEFSTYLAWLPNPTVKDSLREMAIKKLKESIDPNVTDIDPTTTNNLTYIEQCLGAPDQDKLLGHHVTLFFDKTKNTSIVKEGDLLEVSIKEVGWSPTNVVFVVDVVKDEETITSQLGNGNRTHMTYSCNKAKGGKPVDSGDFLKFTTRIMLDEPLAITGTVHELYTENSNRLHGGDPPQRKKVQQKQPKPTGKRPQQIYKELLEEKQIQMTPDLMKKFMAHFKDKNPSEEDIIAYIG